MHLYELVDVGELTAPALVVAFDGWVNAGSAGTDAAEHIAGGGDLVATFDSDALFDYRANRPVVEFVEGVMTEVEWPKVTLSRRTVDDRDLLVLSGTEPNWHWQVLGEAAADLAAQLGVVEQVSLGGIPSAVPHTRPPRVLATASRPDLMVEGERLPEGVLRVPGAAVSIVEHYLVESGVPAVGFWAQVPHYVAGSYHASVVALVERVARHLGVTIPLGNLVDEAAEQRRQLDDLVADQAQAKAYLQQLEQVADDEGPMPTGEEIAAEIERFLEEAGPDDAFGEGGE